ncbi:MAG: hypothetical protein COX07_06795 [Bacteroidetes bacterium CG23_combo_of_CG06-09_8_20_14_all_32_9]|nr:MAG: hypothetical protein COX07_06795 [Bacteroidetes bacterium CG23_combo_of_CG06-09_8_20_14_all_32_9]
MVLIIGIIYNTYDATVRFIKSLEQYGDSNIDLILVDNSEQKSPEKFKKYIGNSPLKLMYIRCENNLGYFGGARKGLDEYRKAKALPEWIIVCNVDIVFNDPSFFNKLYDFKRKENLGIIAPSIISNRWNTDYNPKIPVRYSKKKLIFYKAIYSVCFIQNLYIALSYLKKMTHRFKNTKTAIPDNTGREIYAPHGSCIIFHRNYFEKGGTLNHISFLFGEEVFVAETALKTGLKVVYYPVLQVLDFEHASIGVFYSDKVCRLNRQSIIDIITHYYTDKQS